MISPTPAEALEILDADKQPAATAAPTEEKVEEPSTEEASEPASE